jgi:hypothetical protein
MRSYSWWILHDSCLFAWCLPVSHIPGELVCWFGILLSDVNRYTVGASLILVEKASHTLFSIIRLILLADSNWPSRGSPFVGRLTLFMQFNTHMCSIIPGVKPFYSGFQLTSRDLPICVELNEVFYLLWSIHSAVAIVIILQGKSWMGCASFLM